MSVGKRRVPLGVIGAIYESRPNVTIDISSLCLKSGNAIILRGGSDAINSNTALAALVKDSIADAGIPNDAVQVMETTDRAVVGQMLTAKGIIDLLIPRGSPGAHQSGGVRSQRFRDNRRRRCVPHLC